MSHAHEAQPDGDAEISAFVANLPGAAYRCENRPDWPMHFLTEQVRALTGHAPEVILSGEVRYGDLILPEDRDRVWNTVQAALAEQRTFALEYRIQHTDGMERWIWEQGRGTRSAPDEPMLLEGLLFDITDRKRVEQELRASEARYRLLLESLRDPLVKADLTGRLVDVTAQYCRMLGYTAEELLALRYQDITVERWNDMEERILTDQLFSRGYTDVYEKEYRRKDGSTFPVELRAMLARDGAGQPSGIWATVRDISDRKQAQLALRESEARYRALFDHISNGVAIFEARGGDGEPVCKDLNRAAAWLYAHRLDAQLDGSATGPALAEVHTGAEWRQLVSVLRRVGQTGEAEHVPARVYRKDGTPRWHESFVYRLPTGELVAVFNEVTALKQHEHQLEQLAYADALTGLPNRVLLSDRLQQAMAQAHRRGQYLAVVYLDLDGFKAVNDGFGHAVGDQLLITLAKRLRQVLRDGDTLARLGGDEMVAALVDLEDSTTCIPILNRMLAAAAKPIPISGVDHRVTVSLGVTFYPQTEEVDADQLLRQADHAMYQAKLSGKNCWRRFDAEQDRSIRGHHERLGRIRQALENNELRLHYQPKVNMRLGKVHGAEALIRWEHPERGILPPSDFLPVLENDPLDVEIGEWVIETALTQIEAWRRAGLHLPVSVNIGARQLQQPDLVDRLGARLAAHPDVPASSLSLEVLETNALEDLARVSRSIAACRALGVSVSLDDFGTGYSSLTYMKRLPVDELKIDLSFVRDILDDPEDLAIVDSILGLSSAFRRATVAEGVETAEHGELLLRLGCELAQGYGIARPMPAQAVPDWLASWRPDPRWVECKAAAPAYRPLLYAGAEHRAWISAIGRHLQEGHPAPPPLDVRQCRFGEWLTGGGLADHPEQRSVRAVETLHRQLHVLAAELQATPASGGADTAALARHAELAGLGDALLVQIRTLIQTA
jgi:diguanylate cyclase (GGDEF)-like protein/PAS domain S-box-containing protein